MCTTWNGHDEIVQTLLDSGTLTDHQNDKRATALSYATIFNRSEIVRVLLRAGTDPNIKPMRISLRCVMPISMSATGLCGYSDPLLLPYVDFMLVEDLARCCVYFQQLYTIRESRRGSQSEGLTVF